MNFIDTINYRIKTIANYVLNNAVPLGFFSNVLKYYKIKQQITKLLNTVVNNLFRKDLFG